MDEMLRSCVCFGRNKRRSSSFEDSSSCRSSEIERGGVVGNDTQVAHNDSLLKLFRSKGWYRQWRKTGRAMSMTKVERTIKAALLIQQWYRRYLARMEVRRRYTWNIFQSIEYAGEQDQLMLYNFFNALITHMPNTGQALESGLSSRSASFESVEMKFADESEDDMCRESSLALNFPLEKKDITTLIDLFRKKKNNRLHAKNVAAILKEAIGRLKRLPNINLASTSISKQITICGDLHGKLDDLLVIFYKNGLPSTDNPYVFNGDFVDRGKKGLEVLLLLLACFLVSPGGLFLNRGNHEDPVMNGRYGFVREVQQKYKKNSEKLMKLIETVYRWLPLGTIINNRIFVVHGGISDTTDIDLLNSLDRGRYVSILRPPLNESATVSSDAINRTEWKQLFDIMWSDPKVADGCEPNTLRGAGTYFGPDITNNFLEKNKFLYLVRSHECKIEGHESIHDNKVITIFSASNYYAVGSNRGAYLKFNTNLEPQFVKFTAQASKTRQLTFKQKVSVIESSAFRELLGRLRDYSEDLHREFKSRDPNNTGKLSLQLWCEAMEEATHLDLPWRLLRAKLAPNDNVPGTVNYLQVLKLLEEDDETEHTNFGKASVAESLYKNKSSMEAIFKILDKDNNGFISLDEFGDAVDLLYEHLPGTDTREQLIEMCKLMDINKDGFVDFNEFLEAFRLCQQERTSATIRPTPDNAEIKEDEDEDDDNPEDSESQSIEPSAKLNIKTKPK